MALCDPLPGIGSISGSIQAGKDGSKLIFKTYKKHVGGKPKTHVYVRSYESLHSRKTPVSQHERDIRNLFKKRIALVNDLVKKGFTRPSAWIIAKARIPNKKGAKSEQKGSNHVSKNSKNS